MKKNRNSPITGIESQSRLGPTAPLCDMTVIPAPEPDKPGNPAKVDPADGDNDKSKTRGTSAVAGRGEDVK